MKSKIAKLIKAFGLEEFRNDCLAKRFAVRYSRGNVLLQLGRIVTDREYEARKRRVLSYDFA